jgi:hypothetical protein
MSYSDVDNRIAPVQSYQPKFSTTWYRYRTSPRYQRQLVNYRARKYGIRNVQPRQVNFLPPNSRQGMTYQMPNDPYSLNWSEAFEGWGRGWRIVNKARSLINGIIKILQFIHDRIHEQGAAAAGNGCSPSCVCVGAAVTTSMVVVGVGLGIGVSVGVSAGVIYAGENMNSTSNGTSINGTLTNFTMLLVGLLKTHIL